MTKINKLEMHGFKSFGRKTEMVFGDGYNVILGPNGSGKSNVSDSLCFVLGKGSAKGLRAEKAANLIYNGGKTKKPASFGEVSIYFDNKDKTFPVDSEEIKITRRVRKKGNSEYYINDEKSTRQTILELLGAANINPDGYNIIMQGDIVKLIEMSTNDRRQLIEEISGINVYEEKKNKALKELEKVDQKLSEAEIIITERKTYLKELKKERDQALKFRELKEKVDRNKATYADIQLRQKKKIEEDLDGKVSEYRTFIEKELDFIKGTRNDITNKKQEIQNINKEVEEKGEKEQVALHKEIEKLKVDIGTNTNRVSSLDTEFERIKNRRKQLNDSVKEIDAKIEEIHKDTSSIRKNKERMSDEISKINEKIDAFKKKNKMDDMQDIDQELEALEKEIDESQKIIEEIRREQQELLREKDKKEFQINTLDEKIAKVSGVSEEHKDEIKRLQQKREELKKATLEITKLLQKGSSLASQIQTAKVNLDKARSNLHQLESKNVSIKAALSGDLAVSNILNNKSEFKTVYGVVSELGEVDKIYAQALEVAAGSKMKSIVVDTDRTAAQCINHLKTKKLGVATFLPLNKIAAQRKQTGIDSVLKSKGVYGYAVDLIKYDPMFKSIFSYIFGNTIVVENIETARRLGIGKYRMVTLTGDVTETSGAMRGGHRKETKLKFQEQKVSEQLSSAQRKLGDYQTLVSNLQKEKDQTQIELDNLREFKANLEGEVIVKEKQLFLDSGDLDATKSAKKDLVDEMNKIDKNINEVQMKISSENRKLAQFKIKKQQLRSKISEMRNPRLLAELNAFQQKKDELKEAILKIDGDLKTYTVQIDTIFNPEKENIAKIIKQIDKEEESFKNEKQKLQNQIKVDKDDLSKKEEKQKEFYDKFKDLFKKRENLHKEIQKLEEQIIKKDEVIRSKEHKMNAFSIENAKVKAEIAGLEEELSRYKNVELYKSKSIEDLKKEINQFERMVENFGNVNMKALEIYESVEEEYNKLLEKISKLTEEKQHVLGMMNEIETKKKELFMKTYEAINTRFQEMFLTLSTKGDAYLELENEKDPLSAGVGIKVRIVGKKFLDIRSLSGGEKTMTALAFIFSIQDFQPASFYILDEVDAALDKKNSEKLSELIRSYCSKAQYIVISHNDAVIEKGQVLYGISMGAHNMSKIVSLQA